MIDIALIRIFFLFHCLCVRRDLLHSFEDSLSIIKKSDIIIVGLAHFTTIDSDDGSHIRFYMYIRNLESFAEHGIESERDISGVFHMLFLIFSDRNDICIIKQNISRHQNWITKGPDTHFFSFSLIKRFFVRMHPFHKSHMSYTG